MSRLVAILLAYKSVVVTLLVVLVGLGVVTFIDHGLGARLERIEKMPPEQAKVELERFLKDESWSRRVPVAYDMLQDKLLLVLDERRARDPKAAVDLCVEVLQRYPEGEAVETCKLTLDTLKIGAARKLIESGEPERAITELEDLISKGLTGETLELAKGEAARARLRMITAQGRKIPLKDLTEQVEKLRKGYEGTESAGLAKDLLTCRKLQETIPREITVDVLSAIMACREVVTGTPDTKAGMETADFLDMLPASVVLVRMDIVRDEALPKDEHLEETLTERLAPWLNRVKRVALFEGSKAEPEFEPRFTLTVRYTEEPGKWFKVKVKRRKKRCAQGRRMTITLALYDRDEKEPVWTDTATFDDSGLTLPEDATPEDCAQRLMEAQRALLDDWPGSTPKPLEAAEKAWK